MIEIAELAEQLEADLEWRQREITFLERHVDSPSDPGEQNCLRRALVVLLYAHFEGYIKNALLSYVAFVNSAKLSCGDVAAAIAAASLDDVFRALRNPDNKCEFFRDRLPDDSGLHRFARDCEFLHRTKEWKSRPARIREELVDAQDNLKPEILAKLLFRLGLDHELDDKVKGAIQQMLGYRNAIAHGEKKTVEPEVIKRLRRAMLSVCEDTKRQILKCATLKAFRA